MAISKIQLPSNSVEDIHDARIPAPASADNSKVLGVTDTSGTLGWVAQSGGSSDAVLYTAQSLTDAQKAQARTNIGAEATLETTTVTTTSLDTPIETTIPSGGFRPKTIYDLGVISSDTTFSLYTTNINVAVLNEWIWSFETGSTAPSITWPSPTGIVWKNNQPPTVNANCLYEIHVRRIGSRYSGFYEETSLS